MPDLDTLVAHRAALQAIGLKDSPKAASYYSGCEKRLGVLA